MDLVNIVYKYINRIINSDKLVELLENIDKSKFSKKEVIELNKLLADVKDIIKNVPIEMDEIEINRNSNSDYLIDILKGIIDNKENSQEIIEFAQNRYNGLLIEKYQ